ncbi:MAG: YybH family protein [Rhizomicrobium sp.]
MRKIFTVAAFLLLSGSTAFAGAKEDMMAADRAFSDMSLKSGAHAAFLAFMADDVRLFDGDHPPILGKAAAVAYYADVEKKNPNGEKTSTLEWKPVEAEASPDGVLGWTRGTWVFNGKKADGSAVKITGYYVTEWRRGKDDKYKFVLDIGGTDGQ